MTTLYPGALDTTTQLKDDAVDATTMATTHANAHNNVSDAIIAVETALGINPKGSYSDVKAWLTDSVVKTPGSGQTITPSADVVAFAVRQGASGFNSNLTEWRNSAGSTTAYVDKAGNFSAQSISIAGTLLASTNLSDSGKLQRKGKVSSNIASSTESMAVGWDIVPGVTPGRVSGATPQTALQVTANNTWNLSIAKGCAHIQGTDDVAQGIYGIVQNATATLALTTQAPATNPRVDAIVVTYNDSYYTANSPADAFVFQQIVGTPTSGANLTNLSGAPGTPADSLLLAYILVLTTDVGVQAGNVLDKRILSGPAVWGEDNHKYRIAVDSGGNLYLGQVS
jgi:hypothetical protein